MTGRPKRSGRRPGALGLSRSRVRLNAMASTLREGFPTASMARVALAAAALVEAALQSGDVREIIFSLGRGNGRGAWSPANEWRAGDVVKTTRRWLATGSQARLSRRDRALLQRYQDGLVVTLGADALDGLQSLASNGWPTRALKNLAAFAELLPAVQPSAATRWRLKARAILIVQRLPAAFGPYRLPSIRRWIHMSGARRSLPFLITIAPGAPMAEAMTKVAQLAGSVPALERFPIPSINPPILRMLENVAAMSRATGIGKFVNFTKSTSDPSTEETSHE